MHSGSVGDGFHEVKALGKHSNTRIVTFSSSLSEQGLKFPPFEPQVENLLKHNWEGITSEEIKAFDVIYLLDNLGVLSGVSKSQIISEHPNVLRICFSPWDRASVPKNPSVETGLVNFSDPNLLKLLQVEGLSGNKYSVDSNNTPNNSELGSWSNIIGFARPIDLGLQRIVPGKKLGRTIGIPTCSSTSITPGNLNFEESKLAKFSLIPGVYYGTCQFTEPVDFPFLEPFESKVQYRTDSGAQDGDLDRYKCAVPGEEDQLRGDDPGTAPQSRVLRTGAAGLDQRTDPTRSLLPRVFFFHPGDGERHLRRERETAGTGDLPEVRVLGFVQDYPTHHPHFALEEH